MKIESKQRKRCDAKKKFSRFDKFGQPYQLRLGQSGETEIRSCCGAILTILLVLTLLAYGGYKIKFIQEHDGATILQSVRGNYFS